MIGILTLVMLIGIVVPSYAGTATLTWDVYPQSPNFKELRIYRGNGALCGSGTIPLQPLMAKNAAGAVVQVVIAKGVPPATTPNTFTDANAPETVGMLCYELAAVDVIPSSTVGGAPTALESIRSNRAIKFVQSSVSIPSNVEVVP